MRLAVRWLGFASLSAPLSLLVIVRLTLFSALINSPFLCDRKCSSTAIGHLIGIRQNHSTATIPGSGASPISDARVSYSLRECYELLIGQSQRPREFGIVDGSSKDRCEPFRGAEHIDISDKGCID